MKTQFLHLCNAISQLRRAHFYHLALRFDANSIAICVKTCGNLMQNARRFDANRMVFQCCFFLQIAFVFVTFWLSMRCWLAESAAYFERGQHAF